jgi:predicted SnoaL-like aldol condensation-catalyzing enzyme
MGRPLLTDSGCCNYDDAALVKWYRTTGAHNSVVIDGRSDAATSSDSLWVARRETGNRIVGWTEDADIVSCRMHSPASEATNAGVAWTRVVALVRDDLVIVHDTFVTTGEHDYGVIFRFAAREVTIDGQRRALVAPGDGGACVVSTPSLTPGTLTLAMEPLSVGGVSTPAPVGTCRFNGEGPAHASYVIAPYENGRAIPSVTQTTQPDGIVVSVSGAGGTRTRVLFGKNGPRLLS